MRLVQTLVVRDEVDIVEAQIAFHLNAGVDFVIATDHESRDGTTEILESFARQGYLRRIAEAGEVREGAWSTRMARLAAVEHGADWVISTDADEFWLPRGETLKDVLAAIPPRYGIVQALVRVLLPRQDDERSFAERMTVRRSQDAPDEESMGSLAWALRPLRRAGAGDHAVPLRAWYPIEILRFPLRSLEQAERALARRVEARSRVEAAALEAQRQGTLRERWAELVLDDAAVDRGVADGSLVVDERLRDVLGTLELPAAERSSHRYSLPVDGVGRLQLRPPDIVDDVAYAGECAAVREVDFEPLEQHIAELERRIVWLEARLWPRVRRRLARLVRR